MPMSTSSKKQEAKGSVSALSSENVADLTSALINLGVGKRDAKSREDDIILHYPQTGVKFELLLRELLRGLKKPTQSQKLGDLNLHAY